MPFEFRLPAIAEGVDQGDVGTIHVKEGDVLAADQLVLELDTDKAVQEVTCPKPGKVSRIHVQSGQTVKVGQPLLTLEDTEAKSSKERPAEAPRTQEKEKKDKPAEKTAAKQPSKQTAPVSGGTIEFKLPAIAEGVDKGEVGTIHVKEGDVIAAEQLILELDTDKAVQEVTCPHAGRIKTIHVKSGQTIEVGQPLLTIEATETESKPVDSRTAPKKTAPAEKSTTDEAKKTAAAPARPATTPPAAPAARAKSDGAETKERVPAPAGPATRRLARELGVDLHSVKGTGPNGRITPEDVQAYVRDRLAGTSAPAAAATGGPAIPPLPDFSPFGEVERQALSKLSRTSAANVSLSSQIVPHVTQHEYVDVTELESGRKRFGQRNESAPKVTMTVLAMKAVITALKAFPNFNASYDAAAGEVVLKKYYHIGVAVDTEHGLVVPVIRDVDRKSVMELAAELTDLSSRARARKLTLPEMQGGSFTITNLGGIGGSFFTPIINYPETAILGLSRAVQQYVIVDGKPEIRLMLPLSLSYDHRVINGADAARFVVNLTGLLADPFKLLSEV